jgi:hypothetical protein
MVTVERRHIIRRRARPANADGDREDGEDPRKVSTLDLTMKAGKGGAS